MEQIGRLLWVQYMPLYSRFSQLLYLHVPIDLGSRTTFIPLFPFLPFSFELLLYFLTQIQEILHREGIP